ncbi:general transcription factor IIH subunit 4 [Anguilla rostrata]|uniref:general transcription factor IIH subunit 4 n=1 Tax=Anguilla rostrata TaxID=7938 RepID=UPI0030CCF81D
MKLRVQLQCKNLHEYLRELSPDVLDRLYNHPATCLAVYSQAEKQGCTSDSAVLPSPPAPLLLRDHDECVSVLMGLRMWHSQQLQGGLQGLLLNPVFKENLRVALLGGWVPHSLLGTGTIKPAVSFLSKPPSLSLSESGEPPCITSAGFQFLLLDTPSQLWYFTLQYLNTAQSRGMDLVEILSFLFQLSFSTLGRDYSVEGMSESLLTFLQHLREFGLVFQRKRKSRRYYPTRLAITLAAGINASPSPSSATPGTGDAGFIVMETNYRLYAYTNSELQIALVALFSEMLYRFPNVVVAQVTRESVQQAIANGITAQQIIHFLRTRAHPIMLKQTPVLPPTITDQIRLWELERDRLQFTEGVLYNQFLSQADFEVLRDRAQGLGVLVWQNAPHRVMVVTPHGHSEVKRFWKRQKSHN